MAKIYTVEEALELVRSEKLGRFNKKKFEIVLLALANDVDFKDKIAKKVGDDIDLEEIMPTKGFRHWLKKQLESAGLDKSESEKVLTKDFKINNVEGLYEFFTEAVYLYLSSGNKFDLLPKEDFVGSMYLKDIPEVTSEYTARNPRTGEEIGVFSSTKKKHKELRVKSSTPSWLQNKKKK